MTPQDKIFALYNMSNAYYNDIMNSAPSWVWTDSEIMDWICSQIGM